MFLGAYIADKEECMFEQSIPIKIACIRESICLNPYLGSKAVSDGPDIVTPISTGRAVPTVPLPVMRGTSKFMGIKE